VLTLFSFQLPYMILSIIFHLLRNSQDYSGKQLDKLHLSHYPKFGTKIIIYFIINKLWLTNLTSPISSCHSFLQRCLNLTLAQIPTGRFMILCAGFCDINNALPGSMLGCGSNKMTAYRVLKR